MYKNIFGLTNTAIKLENISKVIFDDKVIAVDWYFFKTLLKQGLKAVFTNEIVTYYRQYENNTIGLKVENNNVNRCALSISPKLSNTKLATSAVAN